MALDLILITPQYRDRPSRPRANRGFIVSDSFSMVTFPSSSPVEKCPNDFSVTGVPSQ